MIVCLILGMGIPTIPNYIITSSIAAPALLKLGVPLIVSHMFVFYFGIMADLTPPVALAAFAAASISRASPMQTGIKATQIAIAGFAVPFIAIYDPSLMLQGTYVWTDVVYVTFKALMAIVLWGGTVVGFLRGPLSLVERVLAFVAAALLVAALPLTDEIGFALGAAVIAWNVWRSRAAPLPAADLMPLCVAAGGLVMTLALESFTLAWTHSIEKIRWEEDWRIDGGRLVLDRGAGARQRRRHGAAGGQPLRERRLALRPARGAARGAATDAIVLHRRVRDLHAPRHAHRSIAFGAAGRQRRRDRAARLLGRERRRRASHAMSPEHDAVGAVRREFSDWRPWITRALVLAFAALAGLTIVGFTWLTDLAFAGFRRIAASPGGCRSSGCRSRPRPASG